MASDESDPSPRQVQSYKIVNREGKTEVTVTSGTLRGKSVRVIISSPSAAYFNEAPARRTG